jgi:glutamate-1-semialdehyde aminotransferase
MHRPHRAPSSWGDLARTVTGVETRYRERHPRSARRHENATRYMPGGNTRTVLHYSPFSLTLASGRGNRLTDIDGFEYLDLLGEYSAGLYGHTHPIIQAAMKQAIETLFHLEMLERGYYFARRGYIALSLPTTESHCDGFVHVVDDFFAARGALIRSAFT